MTDLTKNQTLGLANLLVATAGDITVNDQGKFVIPAGLINEISTLSPMSSESETQSLDFNSILVPRFGMNQFSLNLGLNEKLNRGNIRNTYLHILKNGVDEEGSAISSKVVDGLSGWINSRKDNDIEFGNDSKQMSLKAANAAYEGNFDIIEGISFADAHPEIQKIKSLPKFLYKIQDEQNLGNKVTLPQSFIKKVEDMIGGKPDKSDGDITTLLGSNNIAIDETAETFRNQTGIDLGPIKEFFTVFLRNQYLSSIKKCVNESGASISPDFVNKFETWIKNENTKTMPSIKPVWEENDNPTELLMAAALVNLGVSAQAKQGADNSNNITAGAASSGRSQSSSASTTQNPAPSLNPESYAQVTAEENRKKSREDMRAKYRETMNKHKDKRGGR